MQQNFDIIGYIYITNSWSKNTTTMMMTAAAATDDLTDCCFKIWREKIKNQSPKLWILILSSSSSTILYFPFRSMLVFTYHLPISL